MIAHGSRAAVLRKFPRVLERPGVAQSVLGLTLDEMYTMNEASGNLAGSIAATALTATGSPTFARSNAGKLGIYYDTTGDYHAGNVHGLGTSAGIYAIIFEQVAVVSGGGVGGRTNAGATDCCFMYTLVGGEIQFLVRDTGANSLAVNSTIQTAADGSLYLAMLQIDKTANTARGYLGKRGGTSEIVTGSITGFGSLTAGTTFGFGAVPPFDRGAAVYWAAVATGAQCEGTLLANIALKLGFP